MTLPLSDNTSSSFNQIFQSNALAIAKVGEPAPWIYERGCCDKHGSAYIDFAVFKSIEVASLTAGR